MSLVLQGGFKRWAQDNSKQLVHSAAETRQNVFTVEFAVFAQIGNGAI